MVAFSIIAAILILLFLLITRVVSERNAGIENKKAEEVRSTKPKNCKKCLRPTIGYNKNMVKYEIHLDEKGICIKCGGDRKINKWDGIDYSRRMNNKYHNDNIKNLKD